MILMIDNYDSFTFNIVQYLGQMGEEVQVFRNDRITLEEIKKMKRVMSKVIAEAPHETLIVLDANSGQNALMQAKEFNSALTLTGAILTKMDGTAKGGVAVGLAQELNIPIKLIGVGERIQDLRSFSSEEFVNSLFF